MSGHEVEREEGQRRQGKEQRIEGWQKVKDSASSRDLKGDCISILRKKALGDRCLKGEQAIRIAKYESQARLRTEQWSVICKRSCKLYQIKALLLLSNNCISLG